MSLDLPDTSATMDRAVFIAKMRLFTSDGKFSPRARFQSMAYGVNVDDREIFAPPGCGNADHVLPSAGGEANQAVKSELARAAVFASGKACIGMLVVTRGVRTRGHPVRSLRGGTGRGCVAQSRFRQFRVRHHGDIVRDRNSREKWRPCAHLPNGCRICAYLQVSGFKFVTLEPGSVSVPGP